MWNSFFILADMDQAAPIGIFDSGIGGLTVAKAINQLLPNEKLLYFGDTAHFPYGDKSSEAIKSYSEQITKFLIEKGCKAVVIACNTASAMSAKHLIDVLPLGFPIINVVSPVAEYTKTHFKYKKVGVIATKGTIGSRIYPKSIHQLDPTITVTSLATPLLAPMIEEGFFDNTISRTIIAEYLNKKNLKDVEALILGCTHYPLIEQEVKEYYIKNNRDVKIINSAKVVAETVRVLLTEKHLLSSEKPTNHHFYVSDYTKSFEKSTRYFFGNELKLEKMNIW